MAADEVPQDEDVVIDPFDVDETDELARAIAEDLDPLAPVSFTVGDRHFAADPFVDYQLILAYGVANDRAIGVGGVFAIELAFQFLSEHMGAASFDDLRGMFPENLELMTFPELEMLQGIVIFLVNEWARRAAVALETQVAEHAARQALQHIIDDAEGL